MSASISSNEVGKYEQSEGYRAIRESAAIVDVDQLQYVLKISGEQALEFLNYNLPGKLFYLQPYSAQTTTLLDSDQKVVDVVQVLNMDDHYLLIGSVQAKERLLVEMKIDSYDVEIKDLSSDKSIVGVEGPYSWRVLRDTFGSDILGLRIYSVMEIDDDEKGKVICVRSGCSGEYAYRIIVDKNQKSELELAIAKVAELPKATLADISLVNHEVCAAVLGMTVHPGDCPIEMGLRFMIDFGKEDYRYHKEISEKVMDTKKSVIAFKLDRAAGEAGGYDLVGSEIFVQNVRCGSVRSLMTSPRLGFSFGYAVMDCSYAFPGHSEISVRDTILATASSPLLITVSNSVTM